MPTGGGKSLCMFLVPVSLGCGAVGIVISPLVGLIEQQVGVSAMNVVTVYYARNVIFKVSQLMSLGVPAIHAVRSEQMTA